MNAKLLRYANALEQLRGIMLAHSETRASSIEVDELLPVLHTAEVGGSTPVPNSQQEMQLHTAKSCIARFVAAIRSGDQVKITYALWAYERVYEGSVAPPKETA